MGGKNYLNQGTGEREFEKWKRCLGKGFLKSTSWEEETTRLGVDYESDYLKWVENKITEKEEVAVTVFMP